MQLLALFLDISRMLYYPKAAAKDDADKKVALQTVDGEAKKLTEQLQDRLNWLKSFFGVVKEVKATSCSRPKFSISLPHLHIAHSTEKNFK